MRYARFSIGILWLLAASAKADQFCFALAESYYEQVYCQLQAKAQTKNLPSFNQFKKNNEQVQFSLLKRPAERNAIKLPMPTKIGPAKTTVEIMPAAPAVKKNPAPYAVQTRAMPAGKPETKIQSTNPKQATDSNSGCEIIGNQLSCPTGNFTLLGNKANHRLAATALSAENKMGLPSYQQGALNQYLTQAYRQYITKMDEIGLGGVTMTYRKFAYLYSYLHSKGLDFSQRFETMYGFLKKDKATMGVSESTRVPQGLAADDCSALDERFYVCDLQGRNYIFAAP